MKRVSPPQGAPASSSAPDAEPARPSPELPYPEAPLASRKATSSEGGGGVLQASDAGLLRRAERREVAGAGNEPGASSPSEEFSTRAENQAEALAVERHQERKHAARLSKPGPEDATGTPSKPPEAKTVDGVACPGPESRADPKPPPRYIDPEVLRAFHDTQPDCLTCGYYRVSAHHLVSRAQGGDDAMANLIPLCGLCHGCLHSGGKWQAYGASMTADAVRDGIGRFLRSEAGEDHLAYVRQKLGVGAAAFLERYGVEEQ